MATVETQSLLSVDVMATTEQALAEYLERQRAAAAYFTVPDTARWLGLSESTVLEPPEEK